MSDLLHPSDAAATPVRPLRMRPHDVAALFSEGPEPETYGKPRLPDVSAAKARARKNWAAFFGRLTERVKPFRLGDLGT